MDFKKVKLFSYGVLLSVFLLIIGVLGVKYIGDYYITTITSTNLVSDVLQRISILRWAIVIVFSVTFFISYISLLIQTCRIDESNESHFYIVMAMLSVIPLCALTLIVRTSHLQILERNKKIEILANSVNEDENVIDDDSKINDDISNIIDEIDKDNKYDNLVENNSSLFESSDVNTYEDDSFENMRNSNFNRDKYLSLKGTIYSKEKKEGKRKISENKWKELEDLVNQLELLQIDEETFYSKKDELLSK